MAAGCGQRRALCKELRKHLAPDSAAGHAVAASDLWGVLEGTLHDLYCDIYPTPHLTPAPPRVI